MSTPPFDLEDLGACPNCRGELESRKTAYACRSCSALWPILERIPRFVDSQQYVGSFGYEWQRHRNTQIDGASRRESEQTFAEKTGLTPDDVRGKLVLDVGVGTGRFADVVARWGGFPVGIDLSLAVLSARHNLDRYYPNAFVAQCDLFKLPFKEAIFDHVYSIGVLHHTPSTRDAFRSIARYVKPGGVVAVGIYEDTGGDYFCNSRRFRRYTTAMSHSLLHFLSHASIPRQHVVEVLKTFSPEISGRFCRAFPMREHPDPQWRVLDTFDWYSPLYQWLHDEREVKRWFEDLGFEDVYRLPEETMVSVRGRRAASGPLKTPPPSEERRIGAIDPLPRWVPNSPALRDAALTALLAAEVGKVFAEKTSSLTLNPGPYVKPAITSVVVGAKSLLGIQRPLLPFSKPPSST